MIIIFPKFRVTLVDSYPDAPIGGYAYYEPSAYSFKVDNKSGCSIAYVLNEMLLYPPRIYDLGTNTDVNWVILYDNLYLILDVFFRQSWPSDVRPHGNWAISKYEWGRKYFPKIYPHVKYTWKIELESEKNILTIKTDDGSRKFTLAFDKILFGKYDYGKEPKYIKFLGFKNLTNSWFPFTKELHFLNVEWYREILTYYKRISKFSRLEPASNPNQYDQYCERLIYRKTGNLAKLNEIKRKYREETCQNTHSDSVK